MQLGSSFSIYGCLKHRNGFDADQSHIENLDEEQGSYTAPSSGETADISVLPKSLDNNGRPRGHHTAGAWGYIFQIIYQASFN